MKLLVVAPYFYPKVGGLENYAWNISKGLKEKYNWDIVVIAANHEEKEYKEEVIEGLKIYRLPYWFKASNTPINLGWFIDIWKILKKERPDIVNGHTPVPFISDLAIIISKVNRIPFILTYHAGSMKKNIFITDMVINIYEDFFLRHILNASDRIICFSSNFIIKYLKKKEKIRYISPGVNLSVFKYSNSKRDNNFLYVGKVEKSAQWKGLNILIAAVNVLSKQHKNFLLKIIGDGDAVNDYKNAVEKQGLGQNISFIGKVTGKELSLEMRNARALILPSLSQAESFGMVLIEAMACGTPVIGSSIGGIPKVIDDNQNGLLFKPGSSKTLVNKLKLLLESDEIVTKFGLNGYKKVKQNFTWELSIKKYSEVLNEFIK